LTPQKHTAIRKEKARSDDQPSAETGFHPGRRHGSLIGLCAAFLFLFVMSFSVSGSTKKGQEHLDRHVRLSDLLGLGFNKSKFFRFSWLQFQLQNWGQSM
jgi:hypothetical protein